MPINIYKEETIENLAWLCNDIWDLPIQILELEKWLEANKRMISPSKYIADIGFTIKKDAGGGGSTFSSNSMKIMAELGIDLYLSEYGCDEN